MNHSLNESFWGSNKNHIFSLFLSLLSIQLHWELQIAPLIASAAWISSFSFPLCLVITGKFYRQWNRFLENLTMLRKSLKLFIKLDALSIEERILNRKGIFLKCQNTQKTRNEYLIRWMGRTEDMGPLLCHLLEQRLVILDNFQCFQLPFDMNLHLRKIVNCHWNCSS